MQTNEETSWKRVAYFPRAALTPSAGEHEELEQPSLIKLSISRNYYWRTFKLTKEFNWKSIMIEIFYIYI